MFGIRNVGVSSSLAVMSKFGFFGCCLRFRLRFRLSFPSKLVVSPRSLHTSSRCLCPDPR